MLKRLHKVDKAFAVFVNRGKGSHRMLVLGTSHYPFPCHDDGSEIDRRYLRDIIRRFGLPPDIFGLIRDGEPILQLLRQRPIHQLHHHRRHPPAHRDIGTGDRGI